MKWLLPLLMAGTAAAQTPLKTGPIVANGTITISIGGGATWNVQSTVPTGSCSSGSMTSVTSGSSGLYICVNGSWVAPGTGVSTVPPLSGTSTLSLLYGFGLTLSGSSLVVDPNVIMPLGNISGTTGNLALYSGTHSLGNFGGSTCASHQGGISIGANGALGCQIFVDTAGTGLSLSTSTLNLTNTAVTAGSYTYASITVDAQGRLTSASNGTTPVTSPVSLTTGLFPLASGTSTIGTASSHLGDNGTVVYSTEPIAIGSTSGATWSTGTLAPSGSCTSGSIYSRTGATTPSLYECVNGAWQFTASSSSASALTDAVWDATAATLTAGSMTDSSGVATHQGTANTKCTDSHTSGIQTLTLVDACTIEYVTPTSELDVVGITAPTFATRRTIRIKNNGTAEMYIYPENTANATAGNRFLNSFTTRYPIDIGAEFVATYDPDASSGVGRWMVESTGLGLNYGAATFNGQVNVSGNAQVTGQAVLGNLNLAVLRPASVSGTQTDWNPGSFSSNANVTVVEISALADVDIISFAPINDGNTLALCNVSSHNVKIENEGGSGVGGTAADRFRIMGGANYIQLVGGTNHNECATFYYSGSSGQSRYIELGSTSSVVPLLTTLSGFNNNSSGASTNSLSVVGDSGTNTAGQSEMTVTTGLAFNTTGGAITQATTTISSPVTHNTGSGVLTNNNLTLDATCTGTQCGSDSNVALTTSHGDVKLNQTSGNAYLGGHLLGNGTAPTTSTCGTISGTDNAFKFTTPGGTTSCSITFHATWTNAPVCIAIPISATGGIPSQTASTTGLSWTALSASQTYNVICEGY